MSPGCSLIGVMLGSKAEPRTFASDHTYTGSPLISIVATPLSPNAFSMRTSVMSNTSVIVVD